MTQNTDAPAPEILIIRRKGGFGDEPHHGGVWKIAYADFMTAMMAFFLVMWLVNASNNEIRASVASYFNPLKLTDTTPPRQAYNDLDNDPTRQSENPTRTQDDRERGSGNSDSNAPQQRSTSPADTMNILADPYDVLKRIGAKVGEAGSETPSDDTKAAETTASVSGEAFIDPFNPLDPLLKADDGSELTGRGESRPVASVEAPTTKPGQPIETTKSNDRAGPEQTPAGVAADNPITSSETQNDKLKAKAAELAKEIAEAVDHRLGLTGPAVRVGVVDQELVIQLTDTSQYGMFEIGSSQPNERLVALIQALVPVIAARQEDIVIKGHTDGRPYQHNGFDNWRLSLARAESAYLLLRSAGLSSNRIRRIEAHAARQLKVKNDPDAAANRRIELYLSERGG